MDKKVTSNKQKVTSKEQKLTNKTLRATSNEQNDQSHIWDT